MKTLDVTFTLTDGSKVEIQSLEQIAEVRPLDDDDYRDAEVFEVNLIDGSTYEVDYVESDGNARTILWQAVEPD
ncbi:MAG: hypothetical protein RM049_25825 [Nostoc sp. DedQUE04]|uniref:hypothetical protein n=1 Tax=Nostoc sp. DedQUE04 TaxID=3075390 RepID=UPI002AD31987|nr:hypothetical protein [Nostoc sp. DedQUE04]MDZ8138682.1 hypothetical protein [Nostoc sp. DedQUE04]